MIYRAVLLISLTAAILFVGGLTTYPSPLVEGTRPTAKTGDPSLFTQAQREIERLKSAR